MVGRGAIHYDVVQPWNPMDPTAYPGTLGENISAACAVRAPPSGTPRLHFPLGRGVGFIYPYGFGIPNSP